MAPSPFAPTMNPDESQQGRASSLLLCVHGDGPAREQGRGLAHRHWCRRARPRGWRLVDIDRIPVGSGRGDRVLLDPDSTPSALHEEVEGASGVPSLLLEGPAKVGDGSEKASVLRDGVRLALAQEERYPGAWRVSGELSRAESFQGPLPGLAKALSNSRRASCPARECVQRGARARCYSLRSRSVS